MLCVARRRLLLLLLLVSLFAVCALDEEAETDEVVGFLGSSFLLDPKITVDPSNEMFWTFHGSNEGIVILDHVPGLFTMEPSEQFKNRSQFNATNGALMINGLKASDEGNYTFTVDGKDLKTIQLLVIAKMKEVIGILSSSVLLDPKIKVDPNKNEILWTFVASNKSRDIIIDHIPNIATMEPSEQFKNRLQLFASYGGLRINRLKASDQGDYIFSVDGQEFRVMQLILYDKIKEVIGVLGSSVLLDPELKVDPSKNDISWTFYGDYILNHIPGHITVEPTDQFKSRLKFDPSKGTLTINELQHDDNGNYTVLINDKEMKILRLLIFEKLSNVSILTSFTALSFLVNLGCDVTGDATEYQWWKDGGEISQHHQLTEENRTLVIKHSLVSDCGTYTCFAKNPISSIKGDYNLILHGLTEKDSIIVLLSGAALAVCSASLHPTVPDHWRRNLLGAFLGFKFHFLGMAICKILVDVAFFVAFFYFIDLGFSPLVLLTLDALTTGLLLSTTYIDTSVDLFRRSGQGTFHRMKILLNLLSILSDCITLGTWIVLNIAFFINSGRTLKTESTIIVAAIIIGLAFQAACAILFLQRFSTRISGLAVRAASSILHPQLVSTRIPGLTIESIGIAATSFVGLVLSLTYAIMFLCWTFKGFPASLEDKWWWWWRLNICHIVSLITILIAFICWIAFKGERCDSNFSTWILLAPSMLGCLLTLSMALPVGHCRNNGTGRDNRTEREQRRGTEV
ncbi:uncharacterized protein LOC144603200 isoform X2 [Rhinoraja longicauda]